MSARAAEWTVRERHHHLLDLGDDVHVAAHLRDFAAHDYVLRGVRVLGIGSVHVVAYYDSQHQSGLTQKQRDLVRAWVRRHALTPGASAVAATARMPVWTSDLDVRAATVSNARDARARTRWLLVGLLPAMLALAFVAYAVAGTAARGGPILVSAASVLALISALVTWRHARA